MIPFISVVNPYGHNTVHKESLRDIITTTISNIFQSTQGLWISLCYCFLNREVRGLIDRRWEHSSVKRTVSRRWSSVASRLPSNLSRFTQETEANWTRSPSGKTTHLEDRYQCGTIVQPELNGNSSASFLRPQSNLKLEEFNENKLESNKDSNSSSSIFPNNTHVTTPLQTN